MCSALIIKIQRCHQDSVSSQSPSIPIEIPANENYPDEPQDTIFKRKIIRFIKELKEFKEDVKKWLNELKGNKNLSDAQKSQG